MPRSKPIPDDEIVIGKRIAEWRKMVGFSRVGFARAAEVDSSLIARVEHGRSRVTYALAWLLCYKLSLNPAWLHTGEGDFMAFSLLPQPNALQLTGNESFLKVFDERLAKGWADTPDWGNQQTIISIEPNADGRLFAQRWIERQAENWTSFVPDLHFKHFVNALCAFGEKTLSSYSLEPPDVVEKRIKELSRRRAMLKQRQHFLDGLKGDGKPIVDTAIPPDKVAPMRSEIPTWRELVSDLKRLTEAPGDKSALAAHLKTSRQNVNKWLRGKGTPSTELTLSVLRWVRDQ